MRRKPFTLIQPEGADTVHFRVLTGRTLCGEVFDPEKAKRVKPLDVPVHDLCTDCMAGHFRKRGGKR